MTRKEKEKTILTVLQNTFGGGIDELMGRLNLPNSGYYVEPSYNNDRITIGCTLVSLYPKSAKKYAQKIAEKIKAIFPYQKIEFNIW